MAEETKTETKAPIKLDIGCGPNPQPGHVGIDKIKFDKVDIVLDITKEKLPYADGEVEEIFTSHFIEHLTGPERIKFVNEAHRVLKKGGKVTIIAPYWAASRAYGDMTHQWPPISDFWFYYLLKSWRDTNAPHDDVQYNPDGYSCDFDATWGYNLHPQITTRNQEFQQLAATFAKEAIQDIIATLIKR